MKSKTRNTDNLNSQDGSRAFKQRNRIRYMFDAIARRYDLINRIFSFRQDAVWRKAMLQIVFKDENRVILDLATGTGEVLLGILKHDDGSRAFGADLSFSMLQGAQRKLKKKGAEKELLVQADAATLCFADHSIDTVTIAFGIRNFAQLSESLEDIFRILRPGGKLVILEFSLPKNFLIRWVYLFYFRYLMTPAAGKLSRQAEAYKYLDRSVEAFPEPNIICGHLHTAGFDPVEAKPLTFGVATLYTARRNK